MKFRQIIYKRLTLYIYQLNSVEYDHEAQFNLLARVLENLRKSSLITDLNIAKAVSVFYPYFFLCGYFTKMRPLLMF